MGVSMQKNIITSSFCILSLIFLPGCWRAVDWAKSNFYQGTCIEQCIQVDQYIKSVRVYDLLSVRATFDALWLSDAVRTAYVDLHTMRYGKSDAERDALVRSQLAENNQYISFFILSSYEVQLIGDNLEWGVFLRIHDHNGLITTLTPVEFKEIDLVPEYRAFFGKICNQFKVVYLVRFSVCNKEGRSLFAAGVHKMALYFRSMNKEVQLVWQLEGECV